MRPKLSIGCVLIEYRYHNLLFCYGNLCDMSLYTNFNYGYFLFYNIYILKATKAIESHCMAQWLSAFRNSGRSNKGLQWHKVTYVASQMGLNCNPRPAASGP